MTVSKKIVYEGQYATKTVNWNGKDISVTLCKRY